MCGAIHHRFLSPVFSLMLSPSVFCPRKCVEMRPPTIPFRRTLGSAGSLLIVAWCGFVLAGCAGEGRTAADLWEGTVDTLPGGAIEVNNPSHGIWDSTTAWQVVEEIRIGTLEGTGPDLFGRIAALEVDRAGRFYVLESQSQELRVFDPTGLHIRTIGREGGGPGEFKQAIGMAWSSVGQLWIVDPGNSRISVFDTTGVYATMQRILGGYVMMPWPGGFDDAGRLYHYGLDLDAEPGGRFVMVRFDTLMNPLDTIRMPQPPDDRYFELQSEGGSMRAGIPYSAGITSRIGPRGYLWFANTGEYRVFKRAVEGDTALAVSRDFEPLPLTGVEVDSAIADLEWFTRQGGRVDRSRFPSVKPAISTLYVDDESRLWVVPVVDAEDRGRLLDVFDEAGRYLGRVRLPFRLSGGPIPLFRNGCIYGVTTDEFDVPYVVRARVEKPRRHM